MEFPKSVLFLVMLMAASLAIANAQTTVDWTLGKDYSSYTTQSFNSGGTIVFNYDNTIHDLEVVSKSDYDNCVSGNALQSFSDGKSTVTLKQGAMYFICGKPGHCAGGMKLQVNVGDSGSSTPATPTTPTTPSSTTPTTPTSDTPSAPSPKDSSDASTLSSRLMLGGPIVLGALFAFLG